jgi:ATP adenylyltransferase
MDKLWAPWRTQYVMKDIRNVKGCVFCRLLKEKKDSKNFILQRTKLSFTILNIYPYNVGHLMIMPLRHVKDINLLNDDERKDLFDLLDQTRKLLDDVLDPGGYNIGINIGKVAGAGFPGHVHIHVVPRWKGDANFMSVTANATVISQSLESLYKKLLYAHQRRNRSPRR